MAVLDEGFSTDLTLVEGDGGVRSCPVSVPERTPRDLRSRYERERARADAAEARAEELRSSSTVSPEVRRLKYNEINNLGIVQSDHSLECSGKS